MKVDRHLVIFLLHLFDERGEGRELGRSDTMKFNRH